MQQRRLLVPALSVFLASLIFCAIVPGFASGATIAQKKAQAARISQEVSALNTKMEFAVEAYDAATQKLTVVQGKIHSNEQQLIVARYNLLVARQNRSNVDKPWTLARVCELFPQLQERYAQHAGSLSGGEQQMLAIGRALIRDARLILLDEPFEGLAPLIVRDLVRVSRELAAQGRTIVLVEQNVAAALALANKATILNNGHVAWQGSAEELRNRHDIMKTYLGV